MPSSVVHNVRVSEEVRDALGAGMPLVALESNVTSNGLPQERRLVVAREAESRIRAQGAIPATIAVIDGQCVVGLSEHQHEVLARGARKLSSRDLGSATARGATGATTISATMAIAELVGIEIVASAGLGGVHRGYQETLDVSPDLHQLVRSRSVVVCAGVKTVLDIPRTLEFRETHGVPMLGRPPEAFMNPGIGDFGERFYGTVA